MKEKELEEIKNKFVNLECVKNRKIKLKDGPYTTCLKVNSMLEYFPREDV